MPARPAHLFWLLACLVPLWVNCIHIQFWSPAGQSAEDAAFLEVTAENSKSSRAADPHDRLSVAGRTANEKAMKGGPAGLLAGLLQVIIFMWMRTIMNVQYYTGRGIRTTVKELWEEGGIWRFYQGIHWALLQAPLTRFGDAFANSWSMQLVSVLLPQAPPFVGTALGVSLSSAWRVLLVPIDTIKTASQVHGEAALTVLLGKVKDDGILQLWSGAFASFAANWAQNFPWWVTLNTLEALWPAPADPALASLRYGITGMMASIVADCIPNPLRVLKTISQVTPDVSAGYMDICRNVMKTDGLSGLLFRGLSTRLLTNVLQGSFFSVAWRLFGGAN